MGEHKSKSMTVWGEHVNGRDMELRDDQGASLRSRPRPLFYIWPSGRPKDKFGLGTGRVYPWRNNRLPACEKNGGAVQSLPAVSHPPSRRDRGYASINLEIKKPSTPPSECWVFPFKQINFLRTFKPERQAPLRKNNGIRLTALRLPAFFENILSIFALYKFYYTL